MPAKHYKRMRRLIDDLHKQQRLQVPLADHEPFLAQLPDADFSEDTDWVTY